MNHRIKLLIEYDGSEFCGWQRQPGVSTVQEELEAAISRVFEQKINIMGASRTDTGVHAKGQVAHFDIDRLLKGDLVRAINSNTPRSIVIKGAWEAPSEFHANLSPIKKTYLYRVLNSESPSAFHYKHSTFFPHNLDLDYLNRCCRYLIGAQDFKSFQNVGTELKSTEREILSAQWKKPHPESEWVEFWIEGDGFLKQMIRNIVGTLFEMQKDNEPPEKMKSIIDTKSRAAAGPTARPEGLYLFHIEYPEHLIQGCRKI